MREPIRTLASAAAGALLCAALVSLPAEAQSVADQVAGVRDGQVRMSYAAKEGVCGNGRNISFSRSTDDWESWCEHGPVRVAIDIEDRDIVDIDTYVGGRWRARDDVTDLGEVPAQQAADYFLSLAASLESDVGEDAIFPAMIADGVVAWPRVLEIAKDDSRPREIRKSATFWLSQAAGRAAVEGLEELVDDEDGDFEVRESAVFALSQLPDDEGVPVLIGVVRSNHDPRIRKQAIFWLGQSGDPRAIALFEELLTQP
jgi:hypothetical protein